MLVICAKDIFCFAFNNCLRTVVSLCTEIVKHQEKNKKKIALPQLKSQNSQVI